METIDVMGDYVRKTGRPLVYKNVVYPYAGVEGASRDIQAEFYRRVLEMLNDPHRGQAAKVTIVAQGAFDAPWKTGSPFLAWDRFAGLIPFNPATNVGRLDLRKLTKDDVQSPAAREILRWFPKISNEANGFSE